MRGCSFRKDLPSFVQSGGSISQAKESKDKMQPSVARKAPHLIRGLGLWSAGAVIVGSMIGQAVFLVASDMARELGSPATVIAVWIIGGIVVLLAAFCY